MRRTLCPTVKALMKLELEVLWDEELTTNEDTSEWMRVYQRLKALYQGSLYESLKEMEGDVPNA